MPTREARRVVLGCILGTQGLHSEKVGATIRNVWKQSKKKKKTVERHRNMEREVANAHENSPKLERELGSDS